MSLLTRLVAEDVSPVIWLIALAELVLAIVLVATGRGKFMIWMGALAASALLLLAVEWLLVTDRERIDTILSRLARAARQEDVEGIMHHLAPECRFANLDRNGVRQWAQAILRDVDIDRVVLVERRVQVFPLRQRAKAEFGAIVTGRQSNVTFHSYPTRWALTFAQGGDGEWRVIEVTQLEGGDEVQRPLRLPGL